jgi:hypothetical protein
MAQRVKDTPIAENAILVAQVAHDGGTASVAELMTINFAFSAMDYTSTRLPNCIICLPGNLPATGNPGGGRRWASWARPIATPDAILHISGS